MICTHKGLVNAIKSLLLGGAKTDVKGKHGITALHVAVQDASNPAVETLLKFKANPNLADNCGYVININFVNYYETKKCQSSQTMIPGYPRKRL